MMASRRASRSRLMIVFLTIIIKKDKIYSNSTIYYINYMLRFAANRIGSLGFRSLACFSSTSEGEEFLTMVEKYFDNAGKHTNIRPDILNFYKKADNVVKFNLTLIRGTIKLNQMTTVSRSFLPIGASIKLINCPQREERGTLKTWILLRWRLLRV